MNSKAYSSSLVLFACFLLFSSAASATAFNITRLLGRYPEFSTLNDYLTQTKLNDQINHHRNTIIIVLALGNTAIANLSAMPPQYIKDNLQV